MKKRKTVLIILGITIILLSVVGISYAYWVLVLRQTNINNLATSCFDVTLMNEKDPIQLDPAYPILDSEGEQLKPFTFTVKNNCNNNVKYQINLEVLDKSKGVSLGDQRLDSRFIKEKLNEVNKGGTIHLLTNNDSVDTTIDDAVESYQLQTGYMKEKEEKTFELRLWMDEDITMDDTDAMNKTFASKVSIIATYAKEIPKVTLVDTILALPKATEGNGLYVVDHKNDGTELGSEWKETPEYRYAGIRYNSYNPQPDYVYNYVMFNDELWNIIGLVNVKTKSGNVEQRVKIVRNARLEDMYKWNEENNNDWTKSTLMKLLNEDYYNSQGDFSSTGLNEEAQKMIDDGIVWNLGGWDTASVLTATAYQYERGDQVLNNNPTTWPIEGDSETKARVGLMYPSDWGYAVGGSTEIRNQCLSEKLLRSYAPYGDFECGLTYNWLGLVNEWFISPSTAFREDQAFRYAFAITGPPGIFIRNVGAIRFIYPTAYLSPSVLVSEGNGSYDTPYVLGLE